MRAGGKHGRKTHELHVTSVASFVGANIPYVMYFETVESLRGVLRGLDGDLDPRVGAQLGEDVGDVSLHSATRKEQRRGDVRVGQTVGDRQGDPQFRRGEGGPADGRTAPRAP